MAMMVRMGWHGTLTIGSPRKRATHGGMDCSGTARDTAAVARKRHEAGRVRLHKETGPVKASLEHPRIGVGDAIESTDLKETAGRAVRETV